MSSTSASNHKWMILSPPDSPLHSEFSPDLACQLMATARKAKDMAYAPYSKFHVGAAVLMRDQDGDIGDVYSGCNVENSSYGVTMCAERNAIFSAVNAGGRKIHSLALTLDSVAERDLSKRSPCGLCRQVISEFADDTSFIIIDSGTQDGFEFTGEVMGIADLLPWSFKF